MYPWKDLKFWDSGEWQVCNERLSDISRAHKSYNPSRNLLFKALSSTPFEKVKVCICGQDPYPDRSLCTGLAFSVPDGITKLPPTLSMIFDEYESDLHYPRPTSGSLEKWAAEGVLLWNVIPSCDTDKSLSHDWTEWSYLTAEIIEKLRDKGIVFVFIGSRARWYAHYLKNCDNCRIIETAHPSPRAQKNKNTKHPFIGSRIFTRINDALGDIGLEPINWRLT
jgi:uracil-DNA glycosylase